MGVVWLNKGFSFWDQTLLTDLLEDVAGPRQIVVVPGGVNEVDEVNMELKQYERVLVIITSDEENTFPIDQLYHPDMLVFASYATPKYTVDKWLPIGPAQKINLPIADKDVPWFFAGQVTHESRRILVEKLKQLGNGKLIETAGFAQGLPQEEYYAEMAKARVVPAPKGYVSPDSFRLYEALELGCIPIAEDPEFWKMLFDIPFPVISDPEQWPGYISDNVRLFPTENNRVMSWWMQQKMNLKWSLQDAANYINTQ